MRDWNVPFWRFVTCVASTVYQQCRMILKESLEVENELMGTSKIVLKRIFPSHNAKSYNLVT